MGDTQNLVSYGSILEGDKAEPPVRIWDVDVSEFSKLSEVLF